MKVWGNVKTWFSLGDLRTQSSKNSVTSSLVRVGGRVLLLSTQLLPDRLCTLL